MTARRREEEKNEKLISVLVLLFSVGVVHASAPATGTPLIISSGLAFSTAPAVDLSNYLVNGLSMQVTYATATIPSVTFTDGLPSTGTFTVVSTATLNPAQATDTLTVASNTALGKAQASDWIFVSSNSTGALANAWININGTYLYNPQNWQTLSLSSQTASSIVSAINSTFPNFTASVQASGSTVTITANQYGTVGNSYTLAVSTVALTTGSVTFSGGQNSAYFSINGLQYVADTGWTVGASSATTANNIAALIASSDPNVTASTTSLGVVTLTALSSGTYANVFTLASSTPAALSTGAATFSGGVNAAYIQLNGVTLTAGSQWTGVSTASGTAQAISNAIMASSALNTLVSSTWTTSSGVISTTATAAGAGRQYSMYAWPTAKISISGPTLTATTSTASNIDTANNAINATNAFTLGLPVLFSTTTGTAPGTLLNQTTYYAMPFNGTEVQLATSSAQALLGKNVGISTQTVLGGGSFKLAPLSFTGTPSWQWQQSNDSSNWVSMSTVTVSSTTFASPYTANSTLTDFGSVNARYMRLNIVGPTTGGVAISVIPYSKQ